ncbi:hypothetical protein [Mangrovicella endophytica]|uniref:hypothetical protein n=1 Tax=Mangrovicella endophytica TaxID=2066697 RepID=UPI000C9E0152|nr:hypothetical protein [Mangrovicella endophytica]
MADVLLHVGVGKTGSSAIQHYLSWNAEGPVAGTNYVYAALMSDGSIVTGSALRQRAARSMNGYVSSTMTQPYDLAGLSRAIEMHRAAGQRLIFSQEDWGRKNSWVPDALVRLGEKVDVVAYIRPQIDYLNAGWWQWWAWDDRFATLQQFYDWFDRSAGNWCRHLSAWTGSAAVNEFRIRLHSSDVVQDFIAQIGGSPDAPADHQKNTSLDPLIIKLYTSLPGIRTPRNSALDDVLRPLLGGTGRAPWVIDRNFADLIIASARDDNRLMLGLLDDEQRSRMEDDPRWWTSDAYTARFEQLSTGQYQLSREEALQVIEKLVAAAHRAGMEKAAGN